MTIVRPHRALIHGGRVIRVGQPTAVRVPGLDPQRRYLVTDVTPGPHRSRRSGLAQGSGVPDNDVSGAALSEIGLAIPAQLTLPALVVLIEAC